MNREWLMFFQEVSCFYCKMFMWPLWNKYQTQERNYLTNIWDSLAIFLEGYAFEREGRNPDYPYAAVDALYIARQENNNKFNEQVIISVWNHFSELLNNQQLNHRVNPLYPSTNPNGIINITSKSSLIEVVLETSEILKIGSFVKYLENLIKNNNIHGAFNLIKKIRGLGGGKISSFFLRDLKEARNINLERVDFNQRSLLQPIDRWVRRIVRDLCNNNDMNDAQIANCIVENSLNNNLNPEQVNMGIWFFGSQIVGSAYRWRNLEGNVNEAKNLLNYYIQRMKSVFCSN